MNVQFFFRRQRNIFLGYTFLHDGKSKHVSNFNEVHTSYKALQPLYPVSLKYLIRWR